MAAYEPRVPSHLPRDAPPSYVLVGGLVFVVLSEPLLLGDFGDEYAYEAKIDVLRHVMDPELLEDREQVVVLRQVLASASTIGFEDFEYSVLDTLNGVTVRSIAHLAALLSAGGAGERFLTFGFQGGMEITLDAEEVDASTQEVMRVQSIPAMCSEDILRSLAAGEYAPAPAPAPA